VAHGIKTPSNFGLAGRIERQIVRRIQRAKQIMGQVRPLDRRQRHGLSKSFLASEKSIKMF